MLLVGIDLDLGHLRRKADATILVSHASIVVPFFLGTALCLFIYPAVAPSEHFIYPLCPLHRHCDEHYCLSCPGAHR